MASILHTDDVSDDERQRFLGSCVESLIDKFCPNPSDVLFVRMGRDFNGGTYMFVERVEKSP